MLRTPVLVLNASFEPISITTARKAIVLVMKGLAYVEQRSNEVLRSARLTIPLPSVIRLLYYRRLPRRVNVVSRRNILTRDRFTCQYCKEKFPASDLTMDHVIPRSRYGASDWGNLVTCCKPCNNRKGNQTPAEAGLDLPLRALYSVHTSRHLVRQAGEENADWRPYLFY